ncbi:hypothetical protein FQA39_LY07691 [Lamprigera yunnana]|nr:hypothetical protein FQA39_LY07691 [Lamprigera yunnana]
MYLERVRVSHLNVATFDLVRIAVFHVARGMGFGYAKELLHSGARGVSLVDINVENDEKTIEEMSRDFRLDKVIFYKCDVSDLDKFKGTDTYYKDNEARILTICQGGTDTAIFDGYSNKIPNNLCLTVEEDYREVVRTKLTRTLEHVAKCAMRVITKCLDN